MYIGNALYIVQLRYVYRQRTLYIGTALYIVQLRYVYWQRTLYSATAICISAPHFIYCDCVIYICTALGHSHEVRGATPSHYEVRTFYGVLRGQMSRNDQDESTSIGRPRAEISLDDVEFLLSLKLNITKNSCAIESQPLYYISPHEGRTSSDKPLFSTYQRCQC